METITICGDAETILDSYDTGDLSHETREELATEFVGAVASMIRAAALAGVEVDYEACHDFLKYDGGKFAHQAKLFGNTGGLVSCKLDAPDTIRDLADSAFEAAVDFLDKSIEQELKIWAS